MAPKRTGKLPPPLTLAINVCEDIAFQAESDVLDLKRCFTGISCSDFPAFVPSIFVHLDLTNGRATVALRMVLYPTDVEEEPVLEMSAMIAFDDPRSIRRICFELGAVTFAEEGEYTVTVYAGDERIAERRVFVFLGFQP